MHNDFIHENPWQALKRYTDARIGLGRAGVSLTTDTHLQFQLAHAKARDAVHLPLDFAQLSQSLHKVLGPEALLKVPLFQVKSQAQNRAMYLQRPDLGRLLESKDQLTLQQWRRDNPAEFDVAFVIADGLSSAAVAHHAAPMLQSITSALAGTALTTGPVVMAEQGRVAIGDPIGEALKARLLVMLIGERPGLSSPDSLGCYFTYQPQSGKNDAHRNCISNIRHEGLSYEEATHKLLYLMLEADKRQLSGVSLKDESDNGTSALSSSPTNLLLESSAH